MTETRFAEPGVEPPPPPPPALGDLGKTIDLRLPSGVSVRALLLLLLVTAKLPVILVGGCIDLVFPALGAIRLLLGSPAGAAPMLLLKSKEARIASFSVLVEIKLGRRFGAVLVPKSDSMTPGPIDFLGGFPPIVEPDTGG